MSEGRLNLTREAAGDAGIKLVTTSGGDPNITFNSKAANRSGLIKYQDNGTNIGRIEYVHNGDRIDMQAGSATGATLSVKNGKVGIDHQSPGGTLTINSAAGVSTIELLAVNAATTTNKISFSEAIIGDESFYIEHDGAGTGADNLLKIHGDTNNDGITIRRDGKVGIKKNDPSVALDVTGEISASDDINTPTKVVIGESATAELRLKKTNAGTGTIRFYKNDGSSSSSVAYIQLDASEDLVYYRPANGKHQFYGSGSHRLEIGGDVFVKGSTDFGVPSGRRVKLDVDTHGHTYLMEEGDNNMKFYIGGIEHANFGGGSCTLQKPTTVNGTFTVNVDADSKVVVGNAGTNATSIYAGAGDELYLGSNNANVLRLVTGGNIEAVGDVIAFSDAKLKTNIKTLDGSKVYDMRGVSFTRLDNGNDGSGVIAQEMLEVAPELVNESSDGTLGVSYGNITGYLIEAIKDLKAEIEDLKKQIK